MSILVERWAGAHNCPMEFSPKYFDRIRIAKGQAKARPAAAPEMICQWEGCDEPGTHRAPVGRQREGEYYHFCFDHVREYNKSYNYFSGLDDDAVAKFQKDSMTGNRPTWTIGVNRWGNAADTADPIASASARVRARLDARRFGGTSDRKSVV